jgi:phosphonate transport system substrate-binding protein
MRMELAKAPSGQKYLRVVSHQPATLAKASPDSVAPAVPVPAQQTATLAPATSMAAPPAAKGPAEEALVIGILPNIGPAALMAQYESLKTYLERTTQQKVRIVLPVNFKAFLDSTMRGEYDLAVAAPHFARVAQIDRGMVPLVMYEPRINALFLSPTDSALRSSADVRGKAIAFANPQSLVAMYGQQWLRQQNMEGGKDYEIKAANSDMGVGRMVLSGDAVAAIMSNGEFRSLPPEESSRMKIVETFARIPNFIVVGHPRLGTARRAQLKVRLKQFVADKDEGQAFLKATGPTGMTDVDDATLRDLDT